MTSGSSAVLVPGCHSGAAEQTADALEELPLVAVSSRRGAVAWAVLFEVQQRGGVGQHVAAVRTPQRSVAKQSLALAPDLLDMPPHGGMEE